MLHGRLSRPLSPRRWLQAGLRRHASATAHDGSAPPMEQPTAPSEDGLRTVRKRKHGHNALPLPPFMDPIAINAKTKHQQPKPLKAEEKTDIDKELEKSIFGETIPSTCMKHRLTFHSSSARHARPPMRRHQRLSPLALPCPLRLDPLTTRRLLSFLYEHIKSLPRLRPKPRHPSSTALDGQKIPLGP
jgi:hypothetical protein